MVALHVPTTPALNTTSLVALKRNVFPLFVCTMMPIALFALSNKIRFARVCEYTFRFFLPFAARKKLDSLELRSSFGDETVKGVYCEPSRFPELKSCTGGMPMEAKAAEP